MSKVYEYETMYILRPDQGDEVVDGAIAKYENFLREQGVEECDSLKCESR